MPGQRVMRFGDVRGHDRVRQLLRSAAVEGRLAHALLFAGPDGIGKRAVALALAARLLCEESGVDACGSCASCSQVAAGSHADLRIVTLPSGKKEIGVDRARDLKRFMQLRPLGGRAKIGIIDDAHLLTIAAQNALLKTLEEPPPRSFLVLVANNPDGLLSTVRSRCQRIPFLPLSEATLIDILCATHGLEPAAAAELAELAEGSPGRALALQDSVLGGKRAALQASLAEVRGARYCRLMQLAHELGHPEADVAVKLELVLSHIRDAAVQCLEPAAPAELATLVRQADLVNEAWQAVRHRNPNRQLLLESLLLRMASV